MAKPSRKLKLSMNMKPFISRVVRTGPIQTAFKEKGKIVGDCVKAASKGKISVLSGAQLHAIVKGCAKATIPKGSTIGGSEFTHGDSLQAKKERAQKAANRRDGKVN